MSTQIRNENASLFSKSLKSRRFFQAQMQKLVNLFNVELRALLVSTAIFELAGNIVYVMLVEKAYDLGLGAVSVGAFLILQAATQIAFGSIVGSLTDKIGSSKATILGLLAQAVLALTLANTYSIMAVYFLGVLITLTRLAILTARFPLLTHLGTPRDFMTLNTLVSVLAGAGLFLGPAIASMIYLIGNDSGLPFLVAAGMFLLAILPIVLRTSTGLWPQLIQPMSVSEELRAAWKHILKKHAVREVFICVSISAMIFGAIIPMLTPIARREGFGTEGTGIFFAALGLGWMLGPLSARFLIRRMKHTSALLLTGFLTPIAAFTIGFISSVEGILVALVISAFAGASLNVIGLTIIQRLTPKDKQGCVFGAQQTLAGLVWIVSVALTSGVLMILPSTLGPKFLFYPIGLIGVLMVWVCRSLARRNLRRPPKVLEIRRKEISL